MNRQVWDDERNCYVDEGNIGYTSYQNRGGSGSNRGAQRGGNSGQSRGDIRGRGGLRGRGQDRGRGGPPRGGDAYGRGGQGEQFMDDVGDNFGPRDGHMGPGRGGHYSPLPNRGGNNAFNREENFGPNRGGNFSPSRGENFGPNRGGYVNERGGHNMQQQQDHEAGYGDSFWQQEQSEDRGGYNNAQRGGGNRGRGGGPPRGGPRGGRGRDGHTDLNRDGLLPTPNQAQRGDNKGRGGGFPHRGAPPDRGGPPRGGAPPDRGGPQRGGGPQDDGGSHYGGGPLLGGGQPREGGPPRKGGPRYRGGPPRRGGPHYVDDPLHGGGPPHVDLIGGYGRDGHGDRQIQTQGQENVLYEDQQYHHGFTGDDYGARPKQNSRQRNQKDNHDHNFDRSDERNQNQQDLTEDKIQDKEQDKDLDDLLSQFGNICEPVPEKHLQHTKAIPAPTKAHEQNKRENAKAVKTVKIPNMKQENTRHRSRKSENVPDVNDVYKYIVKEMKGVCSPEQLARQSEYFTENVNMDRWLKSNERRFTLIIREDKIAEIRIFDKEAKYCLDYITSRGCSKANCNRYHICKDLLAGHCKFGGEICRLSHDFLDETNTNYEISKRLGYSTVFTSDEICSIVTARFPHMCESWNEEGTCQDNRCLKLHICQRYLQEKCLEKDFCPLVHDRQSQHNKPIINAFGMADWELRLFAKLLYIKRSAVISHVEENSRVNKTRVAKSGKESRRVSENETGSSTVELETRQSTVVEEHETMETDYQEREKNIKPKPPKPVSRKSKAKSSTDGAVGGKKVSELDDEVIICDLHLLGRCSANKSCSYLHGVTTKLPYIWQAKMFGSWHSLEQSEAIERSFCAKEHDAIVYTTLKDMLADTHVVVNFKTMYAKVFECESYDLTEARRLSTLSYRDERAIESSFSTQWRWMYKDDANRWMPFEPDAMQHTLESKFLAQQEEFLFSEDKYTLDFRNMVQTNLDTGKQRNVLRRPILVTSNDVDTKKMYY